MSACLSRETNRILQACYLAIQAWTALLPQLVCFCFHCSDEQNWDEQICERCLAVLKKQMMVVQALLSQLHVPIAIAIARVLWMALMSQCWYFAMGLELGWRLAAAGRLAECFAATVARCRVAWMRLERTTTPATRVNADV